MDYPGQEELPLVLEEIRTALNARAVILTLHPEDTPPVTLFADPRFPQRELAAGLAAVAAVVEQGSGDGEHRWLRLGEPDPSPDFMVIPVQRVPGHSQLTIGAYFDHLDDEARVRAEGAYLQRRPFAIGYFRLLQLHRAAVRRIGAMESALDRAAMGVALLDRRGRILFVNDALAAILAKGDGLRRFDSQIQATGLADAMRMRVALDHMMAAVSDPARGQEPQSATMISIDRAQQSPLMVLVTAARHLPEEPADAALVLYVTDPELNFDDLIESTCKILGLSRVEGRLAGMLIAGMPLGKAALAMRIKEDTARSYLKQVFAKTGTNRQADLIRLVLSSLVRTSAPAKLETVA